MSKKQKILYAIIVILVGFFCYNKYEFDKLETKVISERYKLGIDYLNKGNLEKARIELYPFHNGSKNFPSNEYKDEKYKDASILYLYAEARCDENSSDLPIDVGRETAKKTINLIPDDYSGQFSKEIKSYKKYISEKVEERETRKKENQKARQKDIDSHLYIGDSESKVRNIMGDPIRVNRTVTSNNITEQWVYDNGRYIYIKNGIVTSFQD